MARTKKAGGPHFLTPKQNKGKGKMMSARIDEALYNDFQRAVELAERNDYDLSYTRVVERALQDAIDEVYETCGEPTLLDAMEHDEPQAAEKPARRSRKKSSEQDEQQSGE